MSKLPKCKLCGCDPLPIEAAHMTTFCGNKSCAMRKGFYTEQQWRTLMGEPESMEDGETIVPVEFLTVIRSALNDGESTEVWSACRDLVRYLELGEAEAAPEPVDCSRSHPHENIGEICKLKTQIAKLQNKIATMKPVNADPVDDIAASGRDWLPLHPRPPAPKPVVKYVELTTTEAFQHLRDRGLVDNPEMSGLYKLVINPDWKPSPPE